MQRIAMLGGGFIGRFYAESIQGQRSRDRVTAIYAAVRKPLTNSKPIMGATLPPPTWKQSLPTPMWI